MTTVESRQREQVKIEKGMILLERMTPSSMPTLYRLWAVVSVRKPQRNGDVTVRLLRYTDYAVIEATATFPGGVLGGAWTLFELSQSDLAHFWRSYEQKP